MRLARPYDSGSSTAGFCPGETAEKTITSTTIAGISGDLAKHASGAFGQTPCHRQSTGQMPAAAQTHQENHLRFRVVGGAREVRYTR
jgi:hypothetical protein